MKGNSKSGGARRFAGRVVLGVSCLAMFALVVPLGARVQRAAAAASLRIDAPSHAAVGQVVSVDLVATAPAPIGAFAASLRYDQRALEVVRVRTSSSLPTTGAVTPLSVAETPNRKVAAGWSAPGGATPATATATGAPARLATVDVQTRRPGQVELRVDGAEIVGLAGQPLGLASASVVITSGAGGPQYAAPHGPAATSHAAGTPAAAPVDIATLTAAWAHAAEQDVACPAPEPGTDVNGDGCLTIADLQRSAATTAPRASAQRAAAPAVSPTFTVNSTADGGDANINGVCQTSTAGQCTLRAALQEANAASGAATVNFAIPGSGVHTIKPNTRLPALDNGHGITIDGFTQSGSSPNTDPIADNAVYTIELVGKGGNGIDGFFVDQSNNVIRGLDMHGFNRAIWIYGANATHNLVEGNMLGLTPTGDFDPNYALVNTSTCVVLQQGAADNQIGAPGNANRNVVSGCDHQDIATYDWPTTRTTIQNNITGLDPTGTQRRGAKSHGIDINTGTQYTLIGGTDAGERNVSSGNSQEGVEISHNPLTLHNSVIDNYIGTDLTGNHAYSYTQNGQWGVHLEGKPDCNNAPCGLDAGYNTVTGNVIVNAQKGGLLVDKGVHDSTISNNSIGVTANGTPAGNKLFGVNIEAGSVRITFGPGNEVAYNDNGVQLQSTGVEPANSASSVTNDNTITQNSIHDNGKNGVAALGIDLAPFGTVNTSSNADPNVNDAIIAPTLSNATSTSIDATTCGGCTVELFIADHSAGSVGSGLTYLTNATANGGGNVTITVPQGARGHAVTATATNSGGSTSEFSRNVQIPGSATGVPGPPSITSTSAGNGWASIAWDPPTLTGTSSINHYTVKASPGGATATVPAPGTRAIVTGLANGTHYTFTVTATNNAGTGDPSPASASTTPAAGAVSVTTKYESNEIGRLQQTASYFGETVSQAQHDSVGIIGYIIGLIPPGPTPLSPPPSIAGPNVISSNWPAADQGVLVSVAQKFALTPAESQKFSTQLVGYLLAIGGH